MRIEFINKSGQRLNCRFILKDIRKLMRSDLIGKVSRQLKALTIIFVRNQESRRLNRRYRNRNHTANVLSFRYNGSGEIIIAPGLLRREAGGLGRGFNYELRRMAIHGLLHLLGYHHEMSSGQAKRFEKLEQNLLKRLEII